MEYQALYRKYRPQRFDEVVGQDHVTRTLSREVVEERIAHAYLFAGPRGTGKTTSARLLAKALNCTNRGADGEPCNACASCLGIIEGTSLDVIELDAASHNKVEDIREIRVNVGTVAAAAGARRVYILDEAHMLSRAAGNALLKTLEEPPEHVIFVLATTEPYKLLDTIRSRAQRFDFHPVSIEVLVDYLTDIAAREGFTVDPEALTMVATHAKGSVRDAMSLLEQVAALGGGKVGVATVARALGLADRDAFGVLADSIVGQDAPAALGLVARLASQGADLRRFVADAVGFFRGVFLAQYAPNLEEVADEPADTLAEWRRFAELLPVADVLRAIDHLGDALIELRQGREERLVTELALLRLTRPEAAADPASLAARVQRLEDRFKALGRQAPSVSAESSEPPQMAASPTAAAPPEIPAASPATVESAAPETDSGDVFPDAEVEVPAVETAPPEPNLQAASVTLAEVEAVWPVLVARIRDEEGPRRHAMLREGSPIAAAEAKIVVGFPQDRIFHLEQLRHDDRLRATLVTVAAELLGGAIDFEFVLRDDEGDAPTEVEEEPARAPTKDELLEEGDEGVDAEALVVDLLGGEVVSE